MIFESAMVVHKQRHKIVYVYILRSPVINLRSFHGEKFVLFIPEAMSLCVVVCTLNGTEITRLATHIAAEMSLTRRSQVHLARSCDRISVPSTPMGISNYPIQCLLLWEPRPGTCTRSCYSVSTSTEDGRGQNLVLGGSCVYP